MLKARIAVDLPSAETQRSMGPVEWVRSLFGAQIDLRSGKEELTVCAFSLVEGLIAGFARAGVADVLSFLVDRQVVYLDSNDVPDDLPPGIYNGMIVDERTSLPRGTLSLRIAL